jgi:hypothetical protein
MASPLHGLWIGCKAKSSFRQSVKYFSCQNRRKLVPLWGIQMDLDIFASSQEGEPWPIAK